MSGQPWSDDVRPVKDGPITYAPPPDNRGKGCLLACLIVSGLLALGTIVLVVVAIFAVRSFINSTIDQYTDPTPLNIPVVTLPEEEMKALKERVQEFEDFLREPGDEGRTLTLTADELNALLAEDADLRGKVRVDIEDDRIKGTVSVPLSSLGRLVRGRFLNGEATIRVTWEDDLLDVRLEELLVRGQRIPEEFMAELKAKNLAEDQDPEQARRLQGLERIEVKEGKITLVAKPRSQRKDLDAPKTKKAPEAEEAPKTEEAPKAEEAPKTSEPEKTESPP